MSKYLILFLILCSCSDNNSIRKDASIHDIDNSYKEVSDFLDKVIIENINKLAKDDYLKLYKYLNNSQKANLFEKKKVFLFYDGLSSGGIWSKPGAKNFGGERVGTFYFDDGPQVAYAIAHIELEGNRNYFYILIDSSDLEGWVGRPYVMEDELGKTFLMPNPITGEKVRGVVDIKFDITLIRKLLIEKPTVYAPSYSDIPWKNCLCEFPEHIKQEGYRLYLEAFQDGERKVDELVRSYMSTDLY